VSQDKIDLVRRFLDAAARDDWPTVLACFHPEVDFVPLRAATEGVFHGHTGIERFIADNRVNFDLFEPAYEFRAVGERVVLWGTVHLRGRGSGVEMDVPSGGIIEFRDGRISRWEDFGSKKKAFAAAGIPVA
jgi:ketosteroid isomerase-like protein